MWNNCPQLFSEPHGLVLANGFQPVAVFCRAFERLGAIVLLSGGLECRECIGFVIFDVEQFI
jgi:hypothetical protein